MSWWIINYHHFLQRAGLQEIENQSLSFQYLSVEAVMCFVFGRGFSVIKFSCPSGYFSGLAQRHLVDAFSLPLLCPKFCHQLMEEVKHFRKSKEDTGDISPGNVGDKSQVRGAHTHTHTHKCCRALCIWGHRHTVSYPCVPHFFQSVHAVHKVGISWQDRPSLEFQMVPLPDQPGLQDSLQPVTSRCSSSRNKSFCRTQTFESFSVKPAETMLLLPMLLFCEGTEYRSLVVRRGFLVRTFWWLRMCWERLTMPWLEKAMVLRTMKRTVSTMRRFVYLCCCHR